MSGWDSDGVGAGLVELPVNSVDAGRGLVMIDRGVVIYRSLFGRPFSAEICFNAFRSLG